MKGNIVYLVFIHYYSGGSYVLDVFENENDAYLKRQKRQNEDKQNNLFYVESYIIQ